MVPLSRHPRGSMPYRERSLEPQQQLRAMPWSAATRDAYLAKESISAGGTLPMTPASSSPSSLP